MPCLDYREVNPATVGQCTGRLDDSKERKNIFDGDILLGKWYVFLECGGGKYYEDIGTVSWDEKCGKWIVTDSSGIYDLYDWCEGIFVIGNIHDKSKVENGEINNAV